MYIFSMTKMSRRRTLILLFSLTIFVLITKLYLHEKTDDKIVLKISHKSSNDTACPIPDFSKPSEYFKPFPDLNDFNCAVNNVPELVKINNGFIHLTKSLQCTYQCVKRESDFSSVLDRKYILKDGMAVPCSYFLVICINGSIQKQFVYTIYNNETLINECSKKLIKKRDVMILSFDSLSYRAWKYYLPKTYHLFHEVLGGVGFEKYNVVGDGTTANIQAMITGTKDTETYETRKRIPGAKFVDDYNWIFNEFKANKYVTLYQEDMTEYGTFQYRLKGFNNQPTDFYGRTGLMFAEKNEIRKHCLGNKIFEEVQLDMLRDFSQLYEQSNTFVFSFMGTLSHDRNQLVHAMDNAFSKFVAEQKRLYPDKVFILVSDHGHRFNSRGRLEGKYEERLPYLGILLPDDMKRLFQSTLIINSKVLITPLDVHATLQHILYGKEIQDKVTADSYMKKQRHRSLFTLLPRNRNCNDVDLPPHWCACLTWVTVDMEANKILLEQIGKQAIAQITKYTDPWRHICAPLTYFKINAASLMRADPSVLAFKQSKDTDGYVPDLTDTMDQKTHWIRVTIMAQPVNALFEVTVAYSSTEKPVKIEELNFREIGRSDRYAPYVKCLTSENLNSGKMIKKNSMRNQVSDIRKFCICKDGL